MPERLIDIGGGWRSAPADRPSALGMKIMRTQGKIEGAVFATAVLGLSWIVAGPADPGALAVSLIVALAAAARWSWKNRRRRAEIAAFFGDTDA